jgi:hypothetical protein
MSTLGFSLFATVALLAANQDTGNNVWSGLLEKGVPVSDDRWVPLPPPTMRDGLDASGQEAVLAKVADDENPLDQLMRDWILAPFQLKIEPAREATSNTPAFRVDLWFVAYGDWEKITPKDVGESLLNFTGRDRMKPSNGRTAAVVPKALARHDIRLSTRPGQQEESFQSALLSLLDQIQIRATYHLLVTRERESIVAAMRIDPRFNDDTDFPNRWQSMDQDIDAPEKVSLGPPHVYCHSGSYGKITRLAGHPGAIFVEYHAVFEEPKAWFQGTDRLRSRMPILIEDEVRSFRGRLSTKKP